MARDRASSSRRAWPVGSVSAAASARWRQADQGQDGVGVGRGVGAVVRPAPADLGGGQDVLADREGPEDLEALEGAGDAEAGPLVGLEAGHVGAVEEDPARVEGLQPADGVEARGLAGAVGADQAGDAAGVDRQVDAAAARARRRIEPRLPPPAEAASSPPMRSGRLPGRAAPGPPLLFLPGQTRFLELAKRTGSSLETLRSQFRAARPER